MKTCPRSLLLTLLLGAGLMGVLARAPLAPAGALQALALLLMTLAVAAWSVYPPAGSALISGGVLACVGWVWATRRIMGAELFACAVLIGVAAWRRRAHALRHQRMRQLLDDLSEEARAVDQGIAAALLTQDALQKKLARYAQLQTIAESLSSLTELNAIAQLVVERAFHLVGKSDVCLLFLVDEERQELSLVASKRQDAIPVVRAKRGDQFDRYVLRTHTPLLVHDARRDFRFAPAASPEREVSSLIACPLLLDQTPAGVLRLDSAQPSAYTQDDLRVLDILLDLVAAAVTNAKLFARTQQLALTDGLTGLMLRRPFLEHFARELSRASRSRDLVAVLLVDVDHFKRYNDTFGHMAGDAVLKRLAETLRRAAPPGAVVARYGGEEFIVLLPRTSRAQAHDAAERLRRLVEEQRDAAPRSATALPAFEPSAAPLEVSARATTRSAVVARAGRDRAAWPVTVSIGVSVAPEDAQTELELIRRADQRLYQAKREGRNQVCSAWDGPPE